MATDYSACGAFGILLLEEELGKVYRDLIACATGDSEEYANDPDHDADDQRHIAMDKFLQPVIERFAELGIAIPDGAAIYHTGVEEDRPGRCAASHDEWIIGFGLYSMPLDPVPYMSDEFKKAATWHTWVAAG